MKIGTKKLLWVLVSVTLIVAASIPVLNLQSEKIATGLNVNRDKLIIVDAGHGGFDGGAVAFDGTVEKDINLEISMVLSEMLASHGYDVIMTRTTDTGTEDDFTKPIQTRKVSDLKNRLSLMNKYPNAVFVSIHLNKFTASSAKGAQVFYSKNHPDSYTLGDSIQATIKSKLQPDNPRVIKQGTRSTYLLYNAKIPAVIVECGFISNNEELQKLKDDKYKKQLAFAVFCGINDFFGER